MYMQGKLYLYSAAYVGRKCEGVITIIINMSLPVLHSICSSSLEDKKLNTVFQSIENQYSTSFSPRFHMHQNPIRLGNKTRQRMFTACLQLALMIMLSVTCDFTS